MKRKLKVKAKVAQKKLKHIKLRYKKKTKRISKQVPKIR